MKKYLILLLFIISSVGTKIYADDESKCFQMQMEYEKLEGQKKKNEKTYQRMLEILDFMEKKRCGLTTAEIKKRRDRIRTILNPSNDAPLDNTTSPTTYGDVGPLREYKAGNYNRAEQMYEDLYKKKHISQYKKMANKCKECLRYRTNGFDALASGEYAEAVDCFNKLLVLNPDDCVISEKLNEIKPWVGNTYLKGCLIFKKEDDLFLAVLPIPELQRKCNREDARVESVKCNHGELMDWRIPSMEEMKIILREIPSDQLGGDLFWFGNFDRRIRIKRNMRTNEITSKEYVEYNATCMDRTGRLIRTDNPTLLANYFLVRDFRNDCIPCPVTTYVDIR